MNTKNRTLAILLITGTFISAQNKYKLDLTESDSAGITKFRAPGVSIGSSSGGPVGPVSYSLPLALRILSATHDREKQRLVADVSLENDGTSVIAIPFSRNSAVHRHGNRGRRKLVLTIHFQSGENAFVRQVAGATFGSETEPDSLLDLKPGETATIRVALRLTDAEEAALVEPASKTTLKAGYYEYTTMDERYEISALTKEVVSAEFRIERAVQVNREK